MMSAASFLPLCCLILSVLFIAAFLAALFQVSSLLFPVSGLMLLPLETLQECRHL